MTNPYPDYSTTVWVWVGDAQTTPRPCVRCGQLTRCTDKNTGHPTHIHTPGDFDCAALHGRNGVFFTSVPAQPVRTEPARPSVRVTDIQHPHAIQAAALIRERVEEALHIAQGDIACALVELDDNNAHSKVVKAAIGDFFALWELSRAHGSVEHHNYMGKTNIPEPLRMKGPRKPDDVWEGRPKWRLPADIPRQGDVAKLDTNAAYVSGLNTHLPLKQLAHHGGDIPAAALKERSGIFLVDPPAWDHRDFPNPLGNRDTPGPVWVPRPQLELLHFAAGNGHCATPVVLESWTAPASAALFDRMRRTLVALRTDAIENDDPLTVAYIKAMYSKFVSTCGESTKNQYVRRPDWMHILRGRAFANLWLRAYKARTGGLQVCAITGTDELHVVGDWRKIWTEGRRPSEMKIKP